MSHTTTTSPTDTDAGPDTERQERSDVLEHIDPRAVTIETNVRTGEVLDADLVDSIREHGVLVPVLGWREGGGSVHVRAGQRRTLAAREAGRVTIPVYVVTA